MVFPDPARIRSLRWALLAFTYFVAGADGAGGIDFTTHYDSDGPFSFLKFDPEPPANGKESLGRFGLEAI